MARKLIYVVTWKRPDGETETVTFNDRARAEEVAAAAPGRALHLYMTGEDADTRRALSTVQTAFLLDMARDGESRAPYGFRDSGRLASAWHRTARSLVARGLITVSNRAQFTLRGIAVVATLKKETR